MFSQIVAMRSPRPQISPQFPGLFVVRFKIRSGVLLCKPISMLFRLTGRGRSFLVPLVLISSPSNGSSAISSSPTARSIATKLAGWFVALPSALVLTLPRPASIRTVLHLAVSRNWPVHQLDINNAFLHGHLSERVLCQQPTGFADPLDPDVVCLLAKSLYGLKQAPRAWYQRFASFITTLGFRSTTSDTSLFVFRHGTDTAYLLLYVDDIVLTASSAVFLQTIISRLSSEFALKDLGALHFFLGINVRRDSSCSFLSQE